MSTTKEFVKKSKKLIKMAPVDFPGGTKFDEGAAYWKERRKNEKDIMTRLDVLRQQVRSLESLLNLIIDEGL